MLLKGDFCLEYSGSESSEGDCLGLETGVKFFLEIYWLHHDFLFTGLLSTNNSSNEEGDNLYF